MLLRLVYSLIIAALLLTAPGLVRAQQAPPPTAELACAPQDAAYKVLKERLDLSPGIIGLTAEGNMLIMFTRPKDGVWAIGILSPDKILCVVAEGTDLQSILPDIKVGRPA